jgi:hypothetical protein
MRIYLLTITKTKIVHCQGFKEDSKYKEHPDLFFGCQKDTLNPYLTKNVDQKKSKHNIQDLGSRI